MISLIVKKKLAVSLCLIGVGITSNVSAFKQTDYSSKTSLIFDEKTIKLNYQVQPELIAFEPEHFIQIGQQKIPLALNNFLPADSQQIIPIYTTLRPTISANKLHEFLDQSGLLKNVQQSTVEIRYTDDKKEKILFAGSPQSGYNLDFSSLVENINRGLSTGTDFIQVPAHKVFSKVIAHPDLARDGIQEILAIGESNFTGSSRARIQNIQAGLNKFNGVRVKKGKIFSFNEILESVDEKDGFVRELVIKGNTTEKELGGGVCQVSTTVFRAALNGGFPIPARRNHSYAVPYYKPFGLDAAIYLGQLDFRFKNDTPGDILIQSYTEEDNIYFVLYGTRDNRTVSLSGPYISAHKQAPEPTVFETEDLPSGEMSVVSEAHDGFTTEWIRTIAKSGQVERETFRSVYRPWPATIKKGTGKNSITQSNDVFLD